jgi:hypothetical protein
MEIRASMPRGILRGTGIVWLSLCAAWGQFGPTQTVFRDSVKGWTGTIDIHGVGSGSVTGQAGFSGTYTADHQIKGTVTLDQYNPNTGAWFGKFAGNIAVSDQSKITGPCTITDAITAQSAGQLDALNKPLLFNITFDLGSDTWSFWPSNEYVPGSDKSTQVCAGISTNSSSDHAVSFMPINMQMGLPFPKTGFNLVGTGKFSCPGCSNVLSSEIDFTFTYNLTAIVDELELVVEPDGFETWRPQAGKTEDTPGNTLNVKATLQHVSGAAPKQNEVATAITFQLQNVSHQPGVAGNFPYQNAKATADLQFTQDTNPDLTVSGNEKDKAETHGGKTYTTATAVVTSFDWGAWGELKVTATLPGGNQIVGYLKGDKTQQNVRLPKRQSNSFIADAWKKDKGVDGKPDNDDSEEEPVGLPNCTGDGLTLYEEYRGFYENGRHIEGNPKKKDFFIRNLLGAEAEAGIWLFTDLSQLEVHKDLNENELIFPDRRINQNHDAKTPHVVDQHAVGIAVCPGADGGQTLLTKAGVRGRPGLIVGICMQGRYDDRRTLTKPYRQSNADQATAYDRAIAHEFFHSVGVEHHGFSDTRIRILIHGPASKYPSEQPLIYWGDGPILILDEATEEDVAERWYLATAAVAAVAPSWSNPWDDDFYVGIPNELHSGEDQCVMRYSLAELYPMGDSPGSIFYAVPPGTEPAGLQICSTQKGTGVNDVERKPRSRYFDTAPRHGNCKYWVCVNDKVPPDPD